MLKTQIILACHNTALSVSPACLAKYKQQLGQPPLEITHLSKTELLRDMTLKVPMIPVLATSHLTYFKEATILSTV